MGKWEIVKLEDVANINMGQSPESSTYNQIGEGVPFYQGNADFGEQYPVKHFWCTVPKKLSAKDDILISVRAPIGAMNFSIETCCIGRGLASITPNPKKLERKYLWYILKSNYDFLNRQGTGSTFKAINKKILTELLIPLPPLDEQKRIAKNLDLASEMVKSCKEQLAELDRLVQSVFYEMFGDPVTNEKGWDSKPLSKTTQIVTGNTPPRNCKDNYGHCIEWIKTDNITDALYVTQASEYLSERGAEIGRVVNADAILMACIAGSIRSIGRVAIVNRTVAFNQQINAIIANEYDTLFLYWLFRMTPRYIQSTINMSLKGILSKGKLEKLVFIVPPLSLQAHFSSIATEIEAQKVQIQQALTEAENLLSSLMQKYFE